MKQQYCALCGHDKYTIIYPANFFLSQLTAHTFSARRIPDKIHYQIVRCNQCGLIYSNPILKLAKINDLYKQSKYTYKEHEKNLIDTYGYYLGFLITPLSKKNNLLEIGCGNGFFLEYAKKAGFKHVYGVEPGSETVNQALPRVRKWIVNDIFKPGQFKPETFDVICCFQVLDHIPDPNEFVRECFKILKPHGLMLCINHDSKAYWAKLLGEKSPIIDIEHTYLFDKTTLPRLFTKHNFDIVDVFDVENHYPLNYWMAMFPLPSLLKQLLVYGLKIFHLGNIRLRIKAGNIGVVAVKNN